MNRIKKAGFGLAALAALAGLAAAWLLPDPDREAALLADRLGAAVGQPARVAGPVSYDYGWPGTLKIARIELGEIGWLGEIAATGAALAGAAEFFGRAGLISGDAERLRFAGDGVSFERTLSGDAWRVEGTLAGRPLAVAGTGATVAVQWGDVAARGTLAWQAATVAVALALEGSMPLAVAGLFDPRENVLEARIEGPVAGLGTVSGNLRASATLLDIAAFELAGGPFAANGALQQEGGRTSLDLRVGDTDLAGLAALAAALPTGDLDLRLRIARLAWTGGEAEGLVLAAARNGDTLAIDELAVRALAGAQLRVRDGQLDLQAPDATRFLRGLGLGVARHLGALSMRGRLAIDPLIYGAVLSPLELSLAGQRATGALSFRDGRLSAQLAGDRIDLGPFFARALVAPPERGPLLTRSQTARAAAAAQPPPPGPGGWGRTPLQFDLIGSSQFDLALAARTLVFDAFSLADAQLAATFAADGISVTRLVGGFWGGRLEAALRLSGGGRPDLALEFALADGELARLAALFGNPQILRGPLSLSGRLATAGRDAAEMAAGLGGQIRMSAPTGSIEGVEFSGLADRLGGGGRAPDLLELGRLLARGGRSDFRNLAGTWTVAKGVARTADTRLVLRGGVRDLAGDLVGDFDVANWRLDLAFGLSAAANAPRAVVGLAGAADRPRVNLSVQLPGQAPGQGRAPSPAR
ncbi:MAG: hypothetical protein ING44_20525 [Telmatospirillum sp.]|nr:hypothetical protein [Telmatospirillum sp.]